MDNGIGSVGSNADDASRLSRTSGGEPPSGPAVVPGATRQAEHPALDSMRAAVASRGQSTHGSDVCTAAPLFLGTDIIRLTELRYSDQQINQISAAGVDRELFKSLGAAHEIVSIGFDRRELPILRRQLTEVASGGGGVAVLNDIAEHWSTLNKLQYSNQQLKEVFMYHGLPGLAALRAANRMITGDPQADDKMPSIHERLIEIGTDENGVQRLRTIAQHWIALRKASSIDEILRLAYVPNGPEILHAWANYILDKKDRSA